MSRPKCLFFLQANSQWFCPQKTFSLSAISLPKTRKHTHTDMNAHIHLHTQIQTHTLLSFLCLPTWFRTGWVRWAQTTCVTRAIINHKLASAQHLQSEAEIQYASAPCIASHTSSFKLTQIAFELYGFKGTQIFNALDDFITPTYRQGKQSSAGWVNFLHSPSHELGSCGRVHLTSRRALPLLALGKYVNSELTIATI